MLELAKLFVPFTRYPYKGATVGCPVCATASSTGIANIDRRFKHLPTVMCDHCGLLYTNPMPTDNELAAYYAKYYRFDYQGALFSPAKGHVGKRDVEAARRAKWLTEFLRPGSSVLDFGCGSGEFVSRMLAEGCDAHGFEPGEAYGSHARTICGDRIRVASWRDVDYDRHFDTVSCFHVLEHLNDPLAALERIVSWLPRDGKAFIAVPNLAPVNGRKGFGFFHFAHVVGFNHFNLLLAAAKAGLTPLKIVSPTEVIFELGTLEAGPEELARQGRDLAMENFVKTGPVSQYLAYQKGKLPRLW